MGFLGSVGKYLALGGVGGMLGVDKLFKSQKGTDTTTSETSPWGPSIPYLEKGLGRTEDWWGARPQKKAGFAPETESAFSYLGNRTTAGKPYLDMGGDVVRDTLAGKYLTPESNPYLGSYVNKAFESTLPQYDTSATNAGRYGSGAWAAMKGRAMGDITSNIYGQAYESERGRQMNAIPYAMNLADTEYGREMDYLENLMKVGEMKRLLEQENLDLPLENLTAYNQMVQGYSGMGSKTTGTQPYYRKAPIWDILGTAAQAGGAYLGAK